MGRRATGPERPLAPGDARGAAAQAALRSRPLTAAELTEEVLQAGRRAGLDAIGVAKATPFVSTRDDLETRRSAGLHGGMAFTYRNPARSTDPTRILDGARSLVVGALSYAEEEGGAPAEPGRGVVARYARRAHYERLDAALTAVRERLEAAGARAVVVVDDNALVDREAAYRAGLGWYGKNTNILLPAKGSWFVLGSVVTDAQLEPAPAPVADGCGSCSRCLPACPTGALVAPGVLDARRCLAWLLQAEGDFPLEFREALGGRIYGCDDCQEACPPSKVELRRRRRDTAGDENNGRVDLVAMLEASDHELLEKHGRWYIPKRDPRYLRRNALVALGNVGDPDDERTNAAIGRYARGSDPMLAEHARWAGDRLEERRR